jgi:PncC family amidohydrolase
VTGRSAGTGGPAGLRASVAKRRGLLTTESIAEAIGRLLTARGQTLALAESCTGGLIGHLITEVPGSSAYFLGSAVTYAYQAKELLLGVPHDTIVTFGVVSEPVSQAMASGVRRVLSADIGVAVTGIAGPGGATPNKPVGLTYVALSAPGYQVCRRFVWPGDRSGNKLSSAMAALELLKEYLER